MRLPAFASSRRTVSLRKVQAAVAASDKPGAKIMCRRIALVARQGTEAIISLLLFALAAVLIAGSARAATFCVTSSAELQNALNAAAANDEDDEIRIYATTFVPPTTHGFKYDTLKPYSLTLAGGYIALLGNPCAMALRNANSTVIDGGGSRRLFGFVGYANTGDLRITRLTFRNGINETNSSPVDIGGTALYNGNITLDRVVVRDNISAVQVIFASSGGSVVVQNSVFADNTLVPGYGGRKVAQFQSVNSNGPSGGVVFNGNTAAGNVSTVLNGSAEVVLGVSNGSLRVANSNFWGNSSLDLEFADFGNSTITIRDSNIGIHSYWGPAISTHNLYSIDPAFIGNGNYRLAGNSPLRDLGDNMAFGGIGSYDAAGGSRVMFGQVDIGAYEIQDDSIFKNGFE